MQLGSHNTYLSAKKAIGLLKVSIIKKLDVDNGEVIGINNNSNKPFYY